MKTLRILITALALTALPAFSKNIHFPEKGDAMFTITIPDDWDPDKDDDGTLEATSPKENVYLAAWQLETDKDADNLGNDIVDLLKDHAKDIKMDGKAQEAHPGGFDGALLKGTAKDKEDGRAIEFFALIISDKKKAVVVYIEANADVSAEEATKLQNILASIKPAK